MQKLRGKVRQLLMHLPPKIPPKISRFLAALKFTKYRLAAVLRPDPLGELKRSPRPPSRNKVGLRLRGGEGRGGEGSGGEGEGGELRSLLSSLLFTALVRTGLEKTRPV